MTYTTNMPRNEYRAALIRWIGDFKPSLYVTFVFNGEISARSAQDRLEEFHQRIDRALLGPKWYQQSEKRSQYVAFIENVITNLHIHAVFHLPTGDGKKFVLVAPKKWSELAPAGNLDIQSVTYADGVADYITKEIRPDTSEQMLLPRHLCAASGDA